MSAEDVFEKFIRSLPKKDVDLDGVTTVRLSRRVVLPLKERGLDIEATIESFLEEIIKNSKGRDFRDKAVK